MEAPAHTAKHRLLQTEVRATLSLAWPLILANLTMALIQATDVLLMGRLGARPLAASALINPIRYAAALNTPPSNPIASPIGRPSSHKRR